MPKTDKQIANDYMAELSDSLEELGIDEVSGTVRITTGKGGGAVTHNGRKIIYNSGRCDFSFGSNSTDNADDATITKTPEPKAASVMIALAEAADEAGESLQDYILSAALDRADIDASDLIGSGDSGGEGISLEL